MENSIYQEEKIMSLPSQFEFFYTLGIMTMYIIGFVFVWLITVKMVANKRIRSLIEYLLSL